MTGNGDGSRHGGWGLEHEVDRHGLAYGHCWQPGGEPRKCACQICLGTMNSNLTFLLYLEQVNTATTRLNSGIGSRAGTAGDREGTPKRKSTPGGERTITNKRGNTPLGRPNSKEGALLKSKDGKQLYAETFKLDDMREELDEFVTYRLPQTSLPIGRPPSPKYAKAVKRCVLDLAGISWGNTRV